MRKLKIHTVWSQSQSSESDAKKKNKQEEKDFPARTTDDEME